MLCGGSRDCVALPSLSLSGDEANVKCAAQAFALIYVVSTGLFSSSSSDVVVLIFSYPFLIVHRAVMKTPPFFLVYETAKTDTLSM